MKDFRKMRQKYFKNAADRDGDDFDTRCIYNGI